jgi:hypothetical protein
MKTKASDTLRRGRGPGRPPLDDEDPSVHVGVRMPLKQYDDLAQRAIRERVSVPELIRRDLQKKE